MKRKIVLYIAVSLDGYIARKNQSVDWLEGDGSNPEADNGYGNFYNSIDTIILGRKTYEQIINELSPNKWVYEGKNCYVATTKQELRDKNVEFVTENIVDFVKELQEQPGRDIWLVGGTNLITPFVQQNLIDQYRITVVPIILGEGIPLFLEKNSEIKLTLLETKSFSGMVELNYIRRF